MVIDKADVDSGTSPLPSTVQSIYDYLPGVPTSEVVAIFKGTFPLENLAKLCHNDSRAVNFDTI